MVKCRVMLKIKALFYWKELRWVPPRVVSILSLARASCHPVLGPGPSSADLCRARKIQVVAAHGWHVWGHGWHLRMCGDGR